MTSTRPHDAKGSPRLSGGALWAGVLGAPMLWSLDLVVRYGFVPVAAAKGDDQTILHALSILFFLGTAICAWICWRDWRSSGSRDPSGNDTPPDARRQFLSGAGLLSCALFLFVIIAEWMPSFFIDSRVD